MTHTGSLCHIAGDGLKERSILIYSVTDVKFGKA